MNRRTLRALQIAIEERLEPIEELLGTNYRLTLIASHNGARGLQDADILLTMTDRETIMRAIDKFLPPPTTNPTLTQPDHG